MTNANVSSWKSSVAPSSSNPRICTEANKRNKKYSISGRSPRVKTAWARGASRLLPRRLSHTRKARLSPVKIKRFSRNVQFSKIWEMTHRRPVGLRERPRRGTASFEGKGRSRARVGGGRRRIGFARPSCATSANHEGRSFYYGRYTTTKIRFLPDRVPTS